MCVLSLLNVVCIVGKCLVSKNLEPSPPPSPQVLPQAVSLYNVLILSENIILEVKNNLKACWLLRLHVTMSWQYHNSMTCTCPSCNIWLYKIKNYYTIKVLWLIACNLGTRNHYLMDRGLSCLKFRPLNKGKMWPFPNLVSTRFFWKNGNSLKQQLLTATVFNFYSMYIKSTACISQSSIL